MEEKKETMQQPELILQDSLRDSLNTPSVFKRDEVEVTSDLPIETRLGQQFLSALGTRNRTTVDRFCHVTSTFASFRLTCWLSLLTKTTSILENSTNNIGYKMIDQPTAEHVEVAECSRVSAQPSAKVAPPADNIFRVTLQGDNDSGQQGYGRHIGSFAPKQHHITIASSITTKNTADSVYDNVCAIAVLPKHCDQNSSRETANSEQEQITVSQNQISLTKEKPKIDEGTRKLKRNLASQLCRANKKKKFEDMERSFTAIKNENGKLRNENLVLCKEKIALHEENQRLRLENDQLRNKLDAYKIQ